MPNTMSNDVPVQDAFTVRVRDILARLTQLTNVRLTENGTFVAECPADDSHDLGAWIGANGRLTLQCPKCSRDPRTAASLSAKLKALMNGRFEEVVSDESVPVSDWLDQPSSSPFVSARRLSNGGFWLVLRPESNAEPEVR